MLIGENSIQSWKIHNLASLLPCVSALQYNKTQTYVTGVQLSSIDPLGHFQIGQAGKRQKGYNNIRPCGSFKGEALFERVRSGPDSAGVLMSHTSLKMILVSRRTESVGILGWRRLRHLHSLLWSGHACFWKVQMRIKNNKKKRFHKRIKMIKLHIFYQCSDLVEHAFCVRCPFRGNYDKSPPYN